MIYLKYLSDLSDLIYLFIQCNLDHELSDLYVRTIWYIMIYLIYVSDLSDWYHDLPCLSVRSTWSRSWSIWSICPKYLIHHDLSDLPVRSIWSRSWSIWSICPINLIYILIYLSDLSDLERDRSDISVRTMIDHYLSDISVRSMWSRSWSLMFIYPIYLI